MVVGNRCIVGVDIGGTFTDIVIWSPTLGIITRKVLSTPADYSLAILDGLNIARELGVPLDTVREIAHGTTLGTNAMLERKGVSTALVTTRGFKDVMTFRRGRQGQPYNRNWQRPEPLVSRQHRAEITERIGAGGEVVTPVVEEEVDALADTLRAWGTKSVAVALINSYANGAHEQQVREILRGKLNDMYMCLSSELLPQAGEYERTSTAIANAYIAPILERYLKRLRDALDALGIEGPLFVSQSSGGLFLHSFATEKAFLTLESGPAAGCIAARYTARQLGCEKAVAVDMGGTTTKASFIEHGELGWASEFVVGAPVSTGGKLDTGVGYVIRAASVDMAEVGAGGGSMAWIDAGGIMHIGPESAGADPGPACYGLGGTRATLTDANVVLGYVNPRALAAGEFPIDKSLAEQSVKELADRLGKTVLETAYGIHLIANANMATAIRRVSTELGRDLRGADMIAFGGSGPVQGVGLAKSLNMRRVIIPRFPGLFSSFGLLTADIEHHAMRSIVKSLADIDVDWLNLILSELKDTLTRELSSHAFPLDNLIIERRAELKFEDRSGEIVVPLPPRLVRPDDMQVLERSFLEEFQRVHRYTPKGSGVQLLDVRVAARIPRPIEGLNTAMTDNEWRSADRMRQVYFGSSAGLLQTPVVSRLDLRHGAVEGPAIIEEADSSTVVQPGSTAQLGKGDVIIVRFGNGSV